MFKSLQLKLAVFLLLPTALILAGVGFTGFIFARNAILDEWREVAVLKLQRAAHQIDMRLERPLGLIEMFYLTGDSLDGYALQERIIERLKELEGVKNVRLEFLDDAAAAVPESMGGMGPGRRMAGRGMMRFHQARFVEVTPPHHDVNTGYETVSLISTFKDAAGREVGKLEVEVRFDHLLKGIQTLGWWQSDIAGLVDDSGAYLAHTEAALEEGHFRFGENGDGVETAMLAAMKEASSGTVIGKGHPPERVGGFCRLELAPWTLVLFAPGEAILEPILRFRSYYAVAGFLSIAVVLILIRWIGGKLVRSIKEIAGAAEAVAGGTYGPALEITSRDEVGLLRERFNAMVDGLKEKDFVTNTFGRYVDPEIARDLLKRPGATRLGGEKREVVILISDIRGFTLAMEPLDPESVIRILNIYYAHMLKAIRMHRGIVVDFFGDGVLVFFDPLEDPVEPVLHRAVCCAWMMQEAMVPFNQAMLSQGLPELEMGVGLHVGEVVVGNIGSETRAKYGIVGTAVNITQRIQMEAKGGQILLSEAAYARIKDTVTMSGSFQRHLKGIQEDMDLHVLERVSGCPDVSGEGPREELRL